MNELLGSAIGLARTCMQYERTRQSDKAILNTLKIYHTDGLNTEQQFEKNREVKYTISPGCKTCESPCGNTDDFDIEHWMVEDQKLVEVKKKILNLGIQLALFTLESHVLEDFNLDFIYKALYVLAEEWEYDYVMDVYTEGLQVAMQLSSYEDVEETIKEGILYLDDIYCIHNEEFANAISLMSHLYANTDFKHENHLENDSVYEVIKDLLKQVGIGLV